MKDSHLDFEGLIARVRSGDPAAFAELYERFGASIKMAVRRRLPERLRIEFESIDFAQDVWASFLTLPPERMEFRHPEAFVGFLTRVAQNKVIDTVRRRFGTQAHDVTREQPLGSVDNPPAGDPTASQWAMAAEKWEELARRLPPGQVAVLERLRDGWTQREIAEALGISYATVKRIVSRIKEVCEQP